MSLRDYYLQGGESALSPSLKNKRGDSSLSQLGHSTCFCVSETHVETVVSRVMLLSGIFGR